MRFIHEEYRVKESDGHVVIKVFVSGHRSFPVQVVAISFVPTKFNLPAGQINMIKHIHSYIATYFTYYTYFTLQQPVMTSKLENTSCISQ